MIEILPTADSGQIECRFSGQITQADYETVLIPALEKALAEHDQVRLLAILDDGFKGYDMGAAWADTKTGLAHWRGFDRVALSTETGWVASGARALAPLFPCPVRVFTLAEVDEARRWLRESLGAIHLTELGGPAVQIQMMGKLDPEAFARVEEGLSAHMRANDGLRLLLDLRAFEGWQGLSALGAHLNIVRAHAGAAERIALVGDKSWQRMAERAASRLLSAETRFFQAGQYDAAKVWVTAE